MKVVVIERDTKAPPFQVIRAVGWIAAVFSLVMSVLLIANNFDVKRLDPIHSPALAKLLEELKANPKDEALREEIRELDLLTRRAFFTSQHFNQMGVALLIGGLVVTVICFKTIVTYKAAPPYPDSSDPKEDLAATALWARKSVTAVGLVLLGFALVLALPWKSPLDFAPVTTEPGTGAALASSATAGKKGPAVVTGSTQPTPVPSSFPSHEERLAQWPAFRGAGGGIAHAGKVPTTWPTQNGAAWKAAVDLPGMNSPVVWKENVLLTGGDASARAVYCFNAGTGELRWKQILPPIPEGVKKALHVSDNTGYAASTMATDGARAFAIFVDGELAAFTLDGKPAWQRNLGLPENAYGYASSLATFEDLLIVQLDRANESCVLAIDAATGKDRWRTPRDFGPSWASPQVVAGPQGPLLLTAATPYIVGYEPRSGKELWRVDCLSDAEVAVSPFYAEGLVYAAAESSGLSAIDVATRKVLWKGEDAVPGICTPLVTDGLILFGLSAGGIVCLDAKDGKQLWREETKDGIYASPILAGGNVYIVSESGNVHILKPSRNGYEPVGTPLVGEKVYATPAAVGNALFVRGAKNLYRFGS